jgi:hypothetical protein
MYGWVRYTIVYVLMIFLQIYSGFFILSRFLFGTCCHLSGEIETSLANAIKQSNNLTQMPSEKQDTLSKKPQIVNNNFYNTATSSEEYDEDEQNFKVSNEAVHISSPAYSSNSYYPTEPTNKLTSIYGASQSYATELPSRIHMSSTLSDDTNEMHNSILFSKDPYDHSDISYVPSDSEIIMENEDHDDNHISSYPSSTSLNLYETKTEEPEKNKYSKPFFKLKPTHSPSTVTEKYVLVHTISNEKPSGELSQQQDALTRKPVSSENDSIQSILLQLNESNPGPEYDVDSTHSNNNYSPISVSTPSYGSSTMIDREKYGVTSYYITTKQPSSSTTATKKQPSKVTTTKLVNKLKVTPTKSSAQKQKLTTPPNIPSTSYVYSPNPIRKRPTVPATPSPTTFVTSSSTIIKKGTTSNIIKKTTTGKPINLIKKPTADEGGYVVISGGGITKHPSPTVHITPKPITNILTASTIQQLQKKPSTVTERPYFSSTPAAIISSSIYLPQNQDFDNEGYFIVSHQPTGNVVSSTAVYSIINNQPTNVKITGNLDAGNYGQQQPDTSMISNDDLTNFPPVRNPNLNMTASNVGIMDESEISTPTFVEDENLNNKIDLLVSKLVASMQGNLDNLIDIVYEKKNVSSVEGGINKNGTISADKPNKTTKIPITTTKPPSRITTGRPSQTSTKKTTTKGSTTTKKPSSTANKKPVSTSSSQSTTRKPPQRGTTSPTLATKRPTRKATTTTSTERAPELEDEEIIDEENGDQEENDVNEENNFVEDNEAEAQPPALENGRIRK